ncbi:kinase-like protein [Artomyces pyxidatus]|uniref:Kinase-like protein n=1 Tax=Artomyces pyxidatus TaxID=48021 RepID=A0ACB8SP12_9AGAM|nr:kinase-like protein [Artomyces pyxidatus]
MPSFKPDFVGRTIDNTLLIVDIIGTGGFGVVYRAIDQSSPHGQQYALKCLRRGQPGSRERLCISQEWLMNSRVDDHPNVVTLHRVIDVDQYAFLVFDLCAGGDLFSAVTDRRVYFRNDELIKLAFVQLIDAIQHCHDRGVYHRDIKPENILCSADGTRLYLADFGLATKHEYTSRRLGSAYYMSPEALGEDVLVSSYPSGNSDIWALGLILLNMITGRSPWASAVEHDCNYADFRRNPYFLMTILPISREVTTLLTRVFSVNPLDRFSLAELRTKILAIDSLFMSDEDLAHATPTVRQAVHAYASQGDPPPPRFQVEGSDVGIGRGGNDYLTLYDLEPEIVPRHESRDSFFVQDLDIGAGRGGNDSITLQDIDIDDYPLPDDSLEEAGGMFQSYRLPNHSGFVECTPPHPDSGFDEFTPRPAQYAFESDSTLVSSSAGSQSHWPTTPDNLSAADLVKIEKLRVSLNRLSVSGLHNLQTEPEEFDLATPKRTCRSRPSVIRRAFDKLKAL